MMQISGNIKENLKWTW